MKDRNSIIKWLIFAALVIASAVVIYPPKDKVRLGLDLAGGTSFTVQIDEEQLREERKAADPDKTDKEIDAEIAEIMKNADDRTVEVLRNRIDSLGVNEPLIVPGKDHRIIIEIPGADEAQRAQAEQSIKSAAFLRFRLVDVNNQERVTELFAHGRCPEGFEIVEAKGRKYYRRLPGYEELVRQPGYKRTLATFEVKKTGYVFMLEPEKLGDGSTVYTPAFVRNRDELTGAELDRADVDHDPVTGEIQVALSFKKAGAQKFSKLTADYCPGGAKNRESRVGRQLAIILDDTLYSAPVIREPIPSGRATISGNFSNEEAILLRNILNAGSLPAPIKVLEKRMIDASLGSDAIRSGICASLIGGALVVIFMLAYYCIFGLVADLALVLNIFMLPLGMVLVSGVFSAIGHTDVTAGSSLLQLPVLTMPGIAGIVLTIGMAVDANVLIFERIREELRLGKSPYAAVDAGYDRAFLAIFDSNLTTFLTAIILFVFGSGPIRGFAITLAAGIVVNMFTALVLTRMVFRLFITEVSKKTYKMNQLIKTATKIDFAAKSRIIVPISVAIIVITIAIFGIRCKTAPRTVMAIDFTGGTVMSYTFEKQPRIEDLRAALRAASIDDAIIQTQAAGEDGKPVVQIKSGYETVTGYDTIAQAIDGTVMKAFPDSGAVNTQEDTIGSQIGADLTRDATKAVIYALIMMIIYITIRFEFGFSLGAVAALAHDVLITLGLYSLFGRQVGVTAIACLLTIVGYSVNDTIVIFDRIREDLRRDPNMKFSDLCNMSLNKTLSRTLLTSVTTLLACLSLFVFGGGAIFDFALCMLIGVIVGTYSSIFIATPVMLAWYKGRRPTAFVQKQTTTR
ncbi:MAG: protein translocase subunit SecD [Kiritimatiellae bacterium]|nr:protein translocase subunit SecD [Kiritimatiellia bacterium]